MPHVVTDEHLPDSMLWPPRCVEARTSRRLQDQNEQWHPLRERSPNCWKSEPMHQIIWNFRPPISVEVSVNPSIRSRLAPLPLPRLARLVLLYTRDNDFRNIVRQALCDTGTILLIARTVEEALQIVCRRKRELDVAIMAFDEDCRGITLLSAAHGCCEQLPTLVVVDKDSAQARALAYANGARFCLSKPVSPVELANAIADFELAAPQLAVA
jgi:CheY-like chemotaxis protein